MKENSLAASLTTLYYDKNPNFKNAMKTIGIQFKDYEHFFKADLLERQKLYKSIAEKIWSADNFDEWSN